VRLEGSGEETARASGAHPGRLECYQGWCCLAQFLVPLLHHVATLAAIVLAAFSRRGTQRPTQRKGMRPASLEPVAGEPPTTGKEKGMSMA